MNRMKYAFSLLFNIVLRTVLYYCTVHVQYCTLCVVNFLSDINDGCFFLFALATVLHFGYYTATYYITVLGLSIIIFCCTTHNIILFIKTSCRPGLSDD